MRAPAFGCSRGDGSWRLKGGRGVFDVGLKSGLSDLRLVEGI